MDAMQLLHTRYSALRLGEPAPSAEAVRAMLESAARAPDHGRLLPWRLILVEGDISLGTEMRNAGTRAPRSVDEFTVHWTRRRGTASAT